MLFFVCPKCRSHLEQDDSELVCRCGSRYPFTDGVPIFTEAEEYYGEVSKERKEQILSRLRAGEYWRNVVFEEFYKSYWFLHHIIVDETRNDFRFHLPVGVERVLDLGTGWGTMSCYFAHDAGEVYALDGTLDRCQFVKLRCEQDGVANVFPVCSSILRHPFPERSFDIVIMNGVLEWVGASQKEGDPRDLQVEALRIVRSLLKDDGALYIGIENSNGFKYLLGANDDHTGIPHIVYLERKAAEEKARAQLSQSYRTYTYDLGGYRQLLADAGFEKTKFYYPVPDYKTLRYMIPLERADSWLYYRDAIAESGSVNSEQERVRSLESNAIQTGTFPHFAASYSIVAGDTKPSFLESLREKLVASSEVFPDESPSEIDFLQVSAPSGKKFDKGRIKLHAFVNGRRQPEIFLTFCRAQENSLSLQKEFSIVEWLARGQNAFDLPRHHSLLSVQGKDVLVTESLAGTSLARDLLARASYIQDVEILSAIEENFSLAADLLKSLRSQAPGAICEEVDFAARIDVQLSRYPALKSQFVELFAELEARCLPEQNLFLHGDFSPWNIFRVGAKPVLVDWELCGQSPFGVIDSGRFVLYSLFLVSLLRPEWGSLDDLLQKVFHERKGPLADLVLSFMSQQVHKEISIQINHFALLLLHEALLQMEYSAQPAPDLVERCVSRLKGIGYRP